MKSLTVAAVLGSVALLSACKQQPYHCVNSSTTGTTYTNLQSGNRAIAYLISNQHYDAEIRRDYTEVAQLKRMHAIDGLLQESAPFGFSPSPADLRRSLNDLAEPIIREKVPVHGMESMQLYQRASVIFRGYELESVIRLYDAGIAQLKKLEDVNGFAVIEGKYSHPIGILRDTLAEHKRRFENLDFSRESVIRSSITDKNAFYLQVIDFYAKNGLKRFGVLSGTDHVPGLLLGLKDSDVTVCLVEQPELLSPRQITEQLEAQLRRSEKGTLAFDLARDLEMHLKRNGVLDADWFELGKEIFYPSLVSGK